MRPYGKTLLLVLFAELIPPALPSTAEAAFFLVIPGRYDNPTKHVLDSFLVSNDALRKIHVASELHETVQLSDGACFARCEATHCGDFPVIAGALVHGMAVDLCELVAARWPMSLGR